MASEDVIENLKKPSLSTTQVTYFIVKCNTADDLETCIRTSKWACRTRLQPPQPKELLIEAHRKGGVILIFSITKNHGWHGYCTSELDTLDIDPKRGSEKQVTCLEHNDEVSSEWDYFPVKWCLHFQDISKQTCLPSAETIDLKLIDGSSVNRARNWQQISERSGQKLCELMSNLKGRLLKHQEYLLEREKEDIEPSFFVSEEQKIKARAQAKASSMFEGWDLVINKVEQEFGKIHLVCPFGSQRYNCSVVDSDSDIFIVYQAKTTQVLGLNPPKPTIKNSNKAEVDYTILELHRYCELLVSGDPRTLETLYLKPGQGVVKASNEWFEVVVQKKGLLTQTCLEKYLREAQGTTGLKQLHKLHLQNNCTEEMSSKMGKLGYIILRLLQNARDMCVSHSLCVFRPIGGVYKQELMDTRHARIGYTSFMSLCHRYLDEIQASRGSLPETTTQEVKQTVEDWLISCRIQDLNTT